MYEGLNSTGAPAVGAEQTDAPDSATSAFQRGGLSTVDDVDTPIGRLALLLLLAGQPGGQYGVKDSATDGALPPGLTLSPAGMLGGKPTAVFDADVTFQVTDALGGVASGALGLKVN